MSANISQTPGYPSDYLKSAGETPKIVPVNILFGSSAPAQPSWLFDYSNNQQQSYLKTLQGLWIDNLDNGSVVTVNILGNSTQRIVAPANSQGYYTVLVSGAIRLTLASAGTAVVPVYFSNQPFTTHIWSPITSGVASSVTIAGPNPLPVSVTAPNPLPVSFATSPVATVVATHLTLTTGFQNLNTIGVAANAAFIQSANKGMILQADPANLGTVLVSDTVGGQIGNALSAGQTLSFDFTNAALFQVRGSVASQILNVLEQNT